MPARQLDEAQLQIEAELLPAEERDNELSRDVWLDEGDEVCMASVSSQSEQATCDCTSWLAQLSKPCNGHSGWA